MTTSRASRRGTTRIAAIAAVAVTVTAAVAIPAAQGAGATKWVTISSGNINNTGFTPSIAKFGNGYEAIWVATKAKSTENLIEARLLNAAGKPVGKVIKVLGPWYSIENDPIILNGGKTRLIAFGADKTGTTSPYDTGAEYYLTSSNGKAWTLNTGSLSAADGADRDNGSAVINDGRTIIAGLATGGAITFHLGASTSNPAPGSDPTSANTGTGTASPGLGVDAKTHQVWAVWFSDSAGKDEGIHAQVISPSLGKLVNGPGSTSKRLGAFGAQQDVNAAARAGGGVYTAYGTPNVHAIDVWKLGAKKPVATIKDPTGVSSIVLTPAPHGRLWLYWRDGTGWRATRSNKAATRFGPVTSLPYPKSLLEEAAIGANGSAGPLEAVADVSTGTSNSLIARQILPKLSVSASPHAVARGHAFTVTVTDAGDAVKGAKVHFDGHTKKTDKKGRAKFSVPHNTSLGKHSVTFTMSGYAAASTQVTVTS